MLEESDDANSLGLLFAAVQDRTVPSLTNTDSNIDMLRKNQKVTKYIRAYLLAGKLGLESIQNQMVDRLITHYLDHPVSVTDIGILLKAGVAKSDFGSLLMRELARGMIDGSYCQTPQLIDTHSEEVATDGLLDEDHDTDTEDNQTIDSGIVADVSPRDTETFHGTDELSNPQDPTTHRLDSNNVSPHRNSAHAFGTVDLVRTSLERETLAPPTANANSTTDLDTGNSILEQIQQNWTIAESTTLMAMLLEAHKSAANPINRSPIELAAANPCSVHLHSITDICPRREPAAGRKRKRGTTEGTECDDCENGTDSDMDCDKGDDNGSVNSACSELVVIDGGETTARKENAGPDNNASKVGNKGVDDNVRKPGPPKKRSRFGWLLRR